MCLTVVHGRHLLLRPGVHVECYSLDFEFTGIFDDWINVSTIHPVPVHLFVDVVQVRDIGFDVLFLLFEMNGSQFVGTVGDIKEDGVFPCLVDIRSRR